MIKNLIEDSYSDIFSELYNITEGNIILGGSLSLKLMGIIDRTPNDLDVMIDTKNWEKYRQLIEHKFRVIPTLQIRIKDLSYDLYVCFDKKTKLNEFHFFINHGDDIFIMFNGLKIFNPLMQIKDKEMILLSGQDIEKHSEDIKLIKKYTDVK